jgi:hypothetical protein
MAGWYIYKHTGERVVICAPIKARIEYRGVEFLPGDRPVIRTDNSLYKVDENAFRVDYRLDPNDGGNEPEPMACANFGDV